jgi:hypothetical protein
LPLGAHGLVSAALGRDDPRFRVRRSSDGWVAGNPAQRLTASFGRDGVVVTTRGLSWSLGLLSVGRGASLDTVRPAEPRVHANSVLFDRGGLQERYANGPLGLEQVFTLARRPSGAGSAPLTLALGLPRAVTAHGGADGVVLQRGGRELIRYAGLLVVDARGRTLPAWLQPGARRVLIRVDDRRAAYPIRVDPTVQSAKLTESPGTTYDRVGSSVSVSSDGSVIAAGAPFVTTLRGAVYVFVRPPGGWANATQAAKLTASDAADNDALGSSVAVSADGSTIVSGAYLAKIGANVRQGAVYVFSRPGGGWADGTQDAKLTVSGGAAQDRVGYSVAVSGDGAQVLAGATDVNLGVNGSKGSAYIFLRPSSAWANTTQTATLTPGDTPANGQFGHAVALSSDGTTAVVGAPYAQISGIGSRGAVYVYNKSVLGWASTSSGAQLTASDGGLNHLLGLSVAVNSGGMVVAGAPGAQPAGVHGTGGAAYVFFQKNIVHWVSTTQNAKLTASPASVDGQIGDAVAVSSDGLTVLAGVGGATAGGHANQGTVLGFQRPSPGWANGTETVIMSVADGAAMDSLGRAVAISGDGGTTVAGAPEAKIGTNTSQGAVYALRAVTTTGVACDPAPATAGLPTTCTATVTEVVGSMTPTGSVVFTSDSSGSFAAGSCTLAPAATPGIATCQTSYTPTAVGSGTHMLTGAYGGDVNQSTSTGTRALAIAPASTSTSVACQPTSAVVGLPTTCTATVTDATSGRITPAGPVGFVSDSSGAFAGGGSCTLVPASAGVASCQATYTPAAIGSGTHALTAAYGGGPDHTASQGTTSEAIRLASTTTSVTCDPLTVKALSVSACTATVTDKSSGNDTPAGQVRFKTSGQGNFGAAASCTLAPIGTPGVASCTDDYTPAPAGDGTHTITANYQGDGSHAASSGKSLLSVRGGPRLPLVTITPRRLVAIRGVVATRVSCPAGETFCDGTESFFSVPASKGSAGKPRKRPVLLGRARFHVPGGKKRIVKVRLSVGGLAKLRSGRPVSVNVVAPARDNARRSATFRMTATLVRKR